MGLRDRTTDGEPHAHAILLRRKKRFEDLFWLREARPVVADFKKDRANFASASPDRQGLRFIAVRPHCVHGVANQVHENLLDLDPVGGRYRQCVAYPVFSASVSYSLASPSAGIVEAQAALPQDEIMPK
jgi:hypothetical protein